MEELVEDILAKKELRSLDKEIAEEFLSDFFQKNKDVKEKLENKSFNRRSEEYKQTVKEIRRKLREIYGVFIERNYSKRDELLANLNEKNSKDLTRELLLLHTSTRERLPYYEEIFKKTLTITGRGKSILDLACGLNPLSYFFLGYKPKYIASDISSKDLDFIDKFFRKTKIKGKTIRIDLVNETKKLEDVPCDICFILKTLDSLETRKRNVSRDIIKKIKSKWIVVSFPKTSLGGTKKIGNSRRNWFINFLKSDKYIYENFETENELFLVVKNK